MMIDQLEGRTMLSAALERGVLTVTGTRRSDGIHVHDVGTRILVRIGNLPDQDFAIASVTKLIVHGEDGNDHIIVGFKTINLAASIFGDDGNDTLEATAASDFVHGGAGNDSLVGNAGNDTLVGGSGRDTLRGGRGTDILNGAGGNDLALTEGTDELQNCESVDPANSFVPMEVDQLGLTIAVDVSTTHPIVTLTFASVPSDAKFDVQWTRHIANRFLIVADVRRNTENLSPRLVRKTAAFDLRKRAPGDYTVEVWSKTAKTKQTQAFTTTVAL
jgi:hypothetical protein